MFASRSLPANSSFARDVFEGLSAEQKHLPSKYFYDERGSQLFRRIMQLDSYYLTRCEYAILQQHAETLRRAFGTARPFNLVELGAGDGLKTKILISHFARQGSAFRYTPIDISPTAAQQLVADVRQQWPQVEVEAIVGDYFKALAQLEADDEARKVVLFMGSNIGNFDLAQARQFLRQLRQHLQSGDLLLLGADLRKDPRRILAAYDEPEGVTAAFNLNLLERINRELDANFDLSAFQFYPSYDPVSGELHSHLVSRRQQHVRIKAIGLDITLKAWESIHTEVSRKYALEEIEDLADACRFGVQHHFTDEGANFVNSLWSAV